jgi:protein involved in polysaccharide export with SLBB domain
VAASGRDAGEWRFARPDERGCTEVTSMDLLGRRDSSARSAVRCLSLAVIVFSFVAGGCASSRPEGPGTVTGTIRLDELEKPEDAGAWEAGEDRTSWEAEAYRLQPGDEIQISVLHNSDMAITTVVLPDGTVSVPVLGQMKAVEKTPGALAADIAEGLAEIIVDPKVSVLVRNLAGNQVFVLGEVRSPGVHRISGQFSVTQALASAGGATKAAKLNSVLVIRRTGPDTVTGFRVSVDKVLKNWKFAEDRILRANDIVYVPTTFIGKIDTFLSQFFAQTASPWLWYIWARRAIEWDEEAVVETPAPAY